MVKKKNIGILGGGQLGKMLIESYTGLNLTYWVLEKSPDCPAALVTDNLIIGSLYDDAAIAKLASKSDVLTYEIEHVNIDSLKSLESSVEVIPKPSVLEIIQDKGLQKEYYQKNGVSTLPFILSSDADLARQIELWPDDHFVLKHRKGGYDGRGVMILSKEKFNKLQSKNDPFLESSSGFVLEKFIPSAREFSVIVATNNQQIVSYKACEMVFDPLANLMDYLIAPADISEADEQKIEALAMNAVTGFLSSGLFAVEIIANQDQQYYVNEIAPRPHNSGHHTIESCFTSQYEQLNRILMSYPLGSTDMLCTALTANILGPEGLSGEYYIDGLDNILSIKGVYLHLYGKKTSSPFRKLGHFTVLGETREDCIQKMKEVRKYMRICK